MEFILKVTAAALKWSIRSEAILTLMESNLQKEISHITFIQEFASFIK